MRRWVTLHNNGAVSVSYATAAGRMSGAYYNSGTQQALEFRRSVIVAGYRRVDRMV